MWRKKQCKKKGRITRSVVWTRVSRRESLLMFIWWNSMRWAQGRDLSRRWLIFSDETSTTTALWLVSAISFSQRCDPMKPPPPIMHIASIGIEFPSRFTRAIGRTKFGAVSDEGNRKKWCGSYNWFLKEGTEKAVVIML